MNRTFEFMKNSPYDRFNYNVFISHIDDKEKFDKFHKWLFECGLSYSSTMLTLQIASSLLLAFSNNEKIQVYKSVEAALKGMPTEYVRRAVALIERYTNKNEFSCEIFCNDIESFYNEMSLKLK